MFRKEQITLKSVLFVQHLETNISAVAPVNSLANIWICLIFFVSLHHEKDAVESAPTIDFI